MFYILTNVSKIWIRETTFRMHTSLPNLIEIRICNQGRTKSLRGSRPVFSAGPHSTEKCFGVC
jgi:hypothetical protein